MVEEAPDTRRGDRRVRLSRDRVVEAAVELADAGGLQALSMRRLADKLGVVPMAIYKHVANKEELLDAMVDLVFAEVAFAEDSGWLPAMRQRAISMRQALRRHPWAIGVMESGTPGPANLRHHDAVMRCLRQAAGFSFPMAVHAYSAMDSYIYGFCLQEETLPFETPEQAAEEASRRAQAAAGSADPEAFARAYPFLAEVVAQLGTARYDYDEEFAFALDLILDGIERLRQQD